MYSHLRYTGGFLVLFCCAFILISCREDRTKLTGSQDQTPVPVKVVTVQEEMATSRNEIMGTVQAVEKAVIAARISGHITEMSVVPGSKVSKGDMLVKINAAEISAQVLQAKAQLAQAERNLERERNLLKKNASTPETVKALEDTNRISLASAKEAQTMLDYATITAPFSGIVARKNADVGDLAVPGKPLLEIENERKFQIAANIPESMILKIKIGDDIPISIPSAGLSITGKVDEVSPASDSLSRTIPIKLSLPPDPNIRSGQFARLSLLGSSEKTIFIPRSALLPFGQMERVFIFLEGKAKLRLVRSGAVQQDIVEILAGLSPGDVVVVAGNMGLIDGQTLKIVQ
jgi:RND family efflux transporter MFP subunit